MLPVVRGVEATARQIAGYAMLTAAATLALTLTGTVGNLYAVSVLVLGAVFVTRAFALHARRVTAACDPLLRVVERVFDARVRRRCRRHPRPLSAASREAGWSR